MIEFKTRNNLYILKTKLEISVFYIRMILSIDGYFFPGFVKRCLLIKFILCINTTR